MSLRSRVISALYNGVSQQPPILRSPDQTEDELNTWATLATGVGKRPPSEHIQTLQGISANAFVHHINRDVTERFIVIIDGGQIRVFDHATGVEKTVNAPNGWAYLAGGKYKAVTVADYTFIVNTEVVPEMDPTVDASANDPAYSIWINRSVSGAYLPGTIANPAGAQLGYTPNPGAGVYRGEVASIEKLPENAMNGDMYKVSGSIESGFVSYYVRRNGAVWDETVANGLQNKLDQNLMPHALVREGDGTFTFAPFSWAPRRVGDTNSNPPPTFIGKPIRDVFFYQNRLGFLVDENVVFSGAGDFGNFWRTTVFDYIASDVIDVAVTTANVALLNHALPSADGIMAFADQTQFSITNGEEGLSPESVAVRPVTHYEVNVKARPVQIGTEVYFCGDNNGSSVVWEYTRGDGTDAMVAAEITAHCPAYLPAGLTHLVAASNIKALFALTGGPDVFVYQFYWNGNEKLQSAWRKWTFDGDVVSAVFLDGYLYMLVRRSGDLFLERVHLEEGAKPAEQAHQVYLDRRVALQGGYNPVTDRTTFQLPYEYDPTTVRIVRGSSFANPGSLIDPTGYQFDTPLNVSVPGDQTAGLATIGSAYNMEFTFSRQFPLDYQGRPLTTGRLQLRTFTVAFSDTAFFRTAVSPYGTVAGVDIEEVVPAKLAEFTGKVVGSNDLILNSPAYSDGAYSFQVYGDAAQAVVKLSNDTHVASTFVSAEWEGFFFSRAL